MLFATVAGLPTAGAIIDHSNVKYIWIQIWEGVVMAAAVAISLASRIAITGWKFKVKIWVKRKAIVVA